MNGKTSIEHVGAGFTPACWGAQNVTVRRTSKRGRKARAYKDASASVRRWALYFIYDQHLHWCPLRLKPQAELIGNRRENRASLRAGRRSSPPRIRDCQQATCPNRSVIPLDGQI